MQIQASICVTSMYVMALIINRIFEKGNVVNNAFFPSSDRNSEKKTKPETMIRNLTIGFVTSNFVV